MRTGKTREPVGFSSQSTSKTNLPALKAEAWQFIVQHRIFTAEALRAHLVVAAYAARRIVSQFEADGLIEIHSGGNALGPKRWAICDGVSFAPDYRTSKQVQFWNTARRLKSWSPLDLVAHSTPEVCATRRDAQAYAAMLLRGGFAKVIQKAIPGQREATYRLIRNTGPKPPREMRVAAIWDENLGAFAYVAGAGQLGDVE